MFSHTAHPGVHFTTTYRYDVFGNLRAVALPDGTKIEYLIDARNRRVGKTVNDRLVQGFLYQDRGRPIAELDGQSKVVSLFVYAGESSAPQYIVRGDRLYRIVTDHYSRRIRSNAGRIRGLEWGCHDE